MEKRVKNIFLTNQKAYIIITLIFYILNLLHYSIIFDISDFKNLIIKINQYLDPFVMLILIVTCFLSFNITSVYSFPFNTLLGKTRCYGLFLKIFSMIFPGILLKKGLIEENSYILNTIMILVIITDCAITDRCFVKVQDIKISGEIISTDITETEYNMYHRLWAETLKLLIVSLSIAGFITAKNINPDIRIIIPVLGLMAFYNWIRFYTRYRAIVRNLKICIISLICFSSVIVYSVFDVFVLNTNTFTGIEYCSLYFIPVLILFSSVNKVNYEMVKYKYANNIGHNLFQIHD